MSKKAIIISVSSDIGAAMARRWKDKGWGVVGTFRTRSPQVEAVAKLGIKIVACDLADKGSVQKSCQAINGLTAKWDVLVLCPGAQEPVGPFAESDFDKWEDSIRVNLTSQLRIVHALLPGRNKNACVIFFAGGGTNDAPPNYSAYTLSKIGLIKMTELLDAEVPDARFVIVGPGWVKTKIHEATLTAKEKAGLNYQRTRDKLAGDECTPMEQVLDCCDWLIGAPRAVVSGRNFSVVFDAWGDERLTSKLKQDKDMYKLRRVGNDFLVRGKNK